MSTLIDALCTQAARYIPNPDRTRIKTEDWLEFYNSVSRDIGARHAGEIEYVFGALELSLPKVPWEPIDRKLSDAMTTYWANFARKGDPNGAGLPKWPRYEEKGRRVLHLDETIRDTDDPLRPRYEALDAYVTKQRGR